MGALEVAAPWWERSLAFNPHHVQSGEHGGEFTTSEGGGPTWEQLGTVKPGQFKPQPEDPKLLAERIRLATEHAKLVEGKPLSARFMLDTPEVLGRISRLGADQWESLGVSPQPFLTYKEGFGVVSDERDAFIDAMDRLQTQMPMALYRGSGTIDKLGGAQLVSRIEAALRTGDFTSVAGFEFQAPDPFESWSHDSKTAHNFAVNSGGSGPARAVLIYDAPKGIHAVNFDHDKIDVGKHREHEWMPRNFHWRIKKVGQVGGPADNLLEIHVEPVVDVTRASAWWEREFAYNPYHVQSGEHGGEFTSGEGQLTEPSSFVSPYSPSHPSEPRKLGERAPAPTPEQLARMTAYAEGMAGKPFPARLQPLLSSDDDAERLVNEGLLAKFGAYQWETSGLLDTPAHAGLVYYKAGGESSVDPAVIPFFDTLVPMGLFRGGDVSILGGQSLADKVGEADGDLSALVGFQFKAPTQLESWSHSITSAERFSSGVGDSGYELPHASPLPRALLIYDAPRGIKAVNLDSPSIDQAAFVEREWILKNTHWKVTDVRQFQSRRGGKQIIELHVQPVTPDKASAPWWERELAYNPYHVLQGEHGGEFTSAEGAGELGDVQPQEMTEDEIQASASAVSDLLKFGGEAESRERIAAKRKIMRDLGRAIAEDESVTIEQLNAFNASQLGRQPPEGTSMEALTDRQKEAEVAANGLVALWTNTSGDHSSPAIAVQLVARDIFGLDAATIDHFDSPGHVALDRARRGLADEHRAVISSALKAMYANTQDKLKGMPDEVWLYRGVNGVGLTRNDMVQLQPLSSFTTDRRTASDFAYSNEDGVHFAMKVPKQRIIGTARTGYGSLAEDELVVLGGQYPILILPR